MPATVADSRSSVKTDPLRNFKFQVMINHNTSYGSMGARLGFMSVSGLSIETTPMQYRQGGFNTTPQQMPGQSAYSPITLSRGMMVGTPDQYAWFQEIFAVIQGTGPVDPSSGRDFRTTIDIYLLAHPWPSGLSVPVKAKWRVYNAWPSGIAWGDLDAGGNAIVAEQMVIQHEGFGVSYASDAFNTDAPALSA